MSHIMRTLVSIAILPLLVGCNYGAAVAQNLGWGAGGMIQSVLVNGDLRGLPQWIILSLLNGAIHGVQ